MNTMKNGSSDCIIKPQPSADTCLGNPFTLLSVIPPNDVCHVNRIYMTVTENCLSLLMYYQTPPRLANVQSSRRSMAGTLARIFFALYISFQPSGSSFNVMFRR